MRFIYFLLLIFLGQILSQNDTQNGPVQNGQNGQNVTENGPAQQNGPAQTVENGQNVTQNGPTQNGPPQTAENGQNNTQNGPAQQNSPAQTAENGQNNTQNGPAQTAENGEAKNNQQQQQQQQQKRDLKIEVSDGSSPTEAELKYVEQYLRLAEAAPNLTLEEFLQGNGYNLTEFPYALPFYGPFLIIRQETPILHRYLPFEYNLHYEVWACNRNRKSLVGLEICKENREQRIGDFDQVEETVAAIHAIQKFVQLTHFCPHCIINETFPFPGVHPVRDYLPTFGYEYDGETMDMKTPAGMGNAIGKAFFEWSQTDNWNADGKMVRSVNPLPYEDYTGYVPPNSPHNLVYPLGWQPLKDTDGEGFFFFQEHVTPQAGRGKTFALTPEDVQNRQVDWPYQGSKLDKQLSPEDEKTIRKHAEELFQIQRDLTDTQKMLAWFFDSKANSISFVPFQMEATNPKKSNDRQIFVETLFQNALYDATVLVWKEKVRHDAVRPPSVIHHIYNNETINAWGGYCRPGQEYACNQEPGQGVKMKGKEFTPYVRTMPHSEYPSASACICEATMEALREASGGIDEFVVPYVAYFEKGSSLFEPGVVPAKDTVVLFRTFSEMSRICGESRLWAGVHFRPAIAAGQELCKGVGKIVYDDLVYKAGQSF